MSDLEELYREIILEHNKHPSHFHALKDATHSAEGFNPLCGDEITLYLKIQDNRIEDVGFEGEGCAISKASASMMTDLFKGKTLDEAKASMQQVQNMLIGEEQAPDFESMGDLAALSGVRQFPMRIKCATLAWHTFEAALKGEKHISTEED